MPRRLLAAVGTLPCSALLLLAPVVGWTQTPRSNGELAADLLDAVLEPVLLAASESADAAGIALRPTRSASQDTPLADLYEDIGNFFHDRGYEVWTLAARDSIPAAAMVLDFEIDGAGIDYPRREGSFLGFGAGETLRRGVLGVSGRLRDDRNGRWLWRGSPRLQVEEWVPTRSLESLAGDEPAWVDAAPPPEFQPDAGWWERGLVAGLLGSVVVLYFNGAN